MTRRLVLAIVSITALGPLLATTGAKGVLALQTGDQDNLRATRSDGSVVKLRPSNQQEVQKLVGYIRDGMNHADQWNKQRRRKRLVHPARKR
jgi:hypothetical protein